MIIVFTINVDYLGVCVCVCVCVRKKIPLVCENCMKHTKKKCGH